MNSLYPILGEGLYAHYLYSTIGWRVAGCRAGTKSASYVPPKVLATLAEIGIHHEGKSKLAGQFLNDDNWLFRDWFSL